MVLLVTFIFWVFLISLARPNTLLNNNYNAYLIIYCFICLVAWKVANLDIYYTNDMHVYYNEFLQYHDISLANALSISEKEKLFTIIQWLLSQISSSEYFFKATTWLMFVMIFLAALRKLFEPWQMLILFVSYMSYFIFFNYVTNTTRQGLAITVLLVATLIFVKRSSQTKTFFISILCAPLIHTTALPLSIVLFLFKMKEIKLKYIMLLWGTAAILFLTHANRLIFERFSNRYLNAYSDISLLKVYTGGTNRLDFFAFGLFFIIIGLLFRKHITDLNELKSYDRLLKIYITFNTYFLLLGFVFYSDRIASYSWFLIPILIWYPILKSKHYNPIMAGILLSLFLGIGLFLGSFDILIKV
jgi:hypothetical protein